MKTLAIALVCFLGGTVAFGQDYVNTTNYTPKKKWLPAAGVVEFGIDWDRYNSMSMDRMMNFAQDPLEMRRDLTGFDENVTAETAGGFITARATWHPLSKDLQTYNTNQELQVGVRLVSPKEAMVTYQSEELDSSIVFCNLHGETLLEAQYIFKGKWGKKWLWHIGGGMSTGWSTGNEMIILSGRYYDPELHPTTQETLTEERFRAKQVYYARLVVPYGIAHQVGENGYLGLTFRRNIGFQFIQGDQTAFLPGSGSFGFSYRYEW